jgi:hypothetical protein
VSTRPKKVDTHCFPIPTSRQSAHQTAIKSQLSSHDDFQLVISIILRTQVMCGESRTRVIVNGEGTEFTNPARSMVSSEGFLVDADDWSGMVWNGGRCWLRLDGMTQRDAARP